MIGGRVLLCALAGLAIGCSNRVIDFTLLSSKNTELTANRSRGTRVHGEDCVTVVIIPFGRPDMKEAVDRAIEKAGPGYDALVDGVVREDRTFLFGKNCVVVDGSPVAGNGRGTPAINAASPSGATASASASAAGSSSSTATQKRRTGK